MTHGFDRAPDVDLVDVALEEQPAYPEGMTAFLPRTDGKRG